MTVAEFPLSTTDPEIPVLGLELGLPERPEFVIAELPTVAEDGTWSIRGLRSVRDVEPSDRKQAFALAQEAIEAGDPRRADYYMRWTIVDDPDASPGWIALANFYVDYGQMLASRSSI